MRTRILVIFGICIGMIAAWKIFSDQLHKHVLRQLNTTASPVSSLPSSPRKKKSRQEKTPQQESFPKYPESDREFLQGVQSTLDK